MDTLDQTLAILSAMITPVVLIMASSSLILSTSQRLSRSIARARDVSDAIKELLAQADQAGNSAELHVHIQQLEFASRRARLLQAAMTSLYVTLFFFVASCISIAVVYFVSSRYAWFPIVLDLLGVGGLCYASILLVKESSVALSAVHSEMQHTMQQFERHRQRQRRHGYPFWFWRTRD